MEAYASYLNDQSATYVVSTMGVTDIPTLKDGFQIPSSVGIQISREADSASFFKPNEICFYEIAFERGLRLPIDDHIREFLYLLILLPINSILILGPASSPLSSCSELFPREALDHSRGMVLFLSSQGCWRCF